ncbi:MAG: chemoreceptor glutamine deamidase CheD, partial [Firmicutes bacterium]|nr:chemoreceptor glutamine deamidase CheD [Bacillota bacterium]
KNIPVLASNIGGRYGRKIYFFPENFDVYVKRINIKKILPAVKQQEKSFLQNRMP